MASGSQTRQRKIRKIAFCNEQEAALFDTLTELHRVSVSELIKNRVLRPQEPFSKAARSPAVNAKEVARLNSELGEATEALKDLCEKVEDQHLTAEIDQQLSEFRLLSIACRKALGLRR